MWIPLLLPLIDIFTDHIFAFLNASQTNSQAVAAIGVALLFNLLFGPMIYGEIILSYVTLYISMQIVYSTSSDLSTPDLSTKPDLSTLFLEMKN